MLTLVSFPVFGGDVRNEGALSLEVLRVVVIRMQLVGWRPKSRLKVGEGRGG